MVEVLLTDEVWSVLDPSAGKLTGRAKRQWYTVTAVTALLAVGAMLVGWSGVLVPRLSARNYSGYDADTKAHTFTYHMQLKNDGRTTVDVRRVFTPEGDGLTLLSVEGVPVKLPPSTGQQVLLSYQVRHCPAGPTGRWPVSVEVKRPWGFQTIEVQPPILTSPHAPSGIRSFSGDDPYGQQWQHMLSNLACTPVGS